MKDSAIEVYSTKIQGDEINNYRIVKIEIEEDLSPQMFRGWATKKADWFDPTVARDDELFGEREHEKRMSGKALKKYGQYW